MGSMIDVSDFAGHLTQRQISALFNPTGPSILRAAEQTSARLREGQRRLIVAEVMMRRTQKILSHEKLIR